ncbi:MAG TPA: surface-adhesin E family protein, partial [Caulobacteraceae bacterium]|nr:surface-adhesin E family protein [Caulobacteraceae bacterium]
MKTSSLSLAAALGAIVALSAAAPQAAPRFVVDPEKPTLERSGWTYIGMADGVLIYMRDAVPGSSGHARRVLTAYETLQPQDREGFAFRSVKSLGEFDCENGRSRVLHETFYAGPEMQGQSMNGP